MKLITWILSLFKRKAKPPKPIAWDYEEIELFTLVNDYRLDDNKPQLKKDDRLYVQAKVRNLTNIKKGTISHEGFNIISGIITRKDFKFCGENIGKGYYDNMHVLYAWIESDNHRDNMEHRGWTHSGVAITKDKQGRNYYCQIFAN